MSLAVTLTQWFEHCKGLTRSEYDNVMLFEGPEGNGKSTSAFQFLKAMDKSFNPSRVAFDIPTFLDMAPTLKPGNAILLDEADLLSHNAMQKNSKLLLNFLKDCRALCLHIAICFPRTTIFNGGIKQRIRWFIYRPNRRHAIIYYLKPVHNDDPDAPPRHIKVEVWRGELGPNTGEEWETYKRLKLQHMRRYGVAAIDERPWDEGLVDELRGLYAEYVRDGKHATASPL